MFSEQFLFKDHGKPNVGATVFNFKLGRERCEVSLTVCFTIVLWQHGISFIVS